MIVLQSFSEEFRKGSLNGHNRKIRKTIPRKVIEAKPTMERTQRLPHTMWMGTVWKAGRI